MIHREESQTDLGTIRIHKNVIASIASLAATEIQGVSRVGGNFTSGILELIGKKDIAAIGVEINKNEEVKIEIPVLIKYGYSIPEVAGKIQENVRHNVEKMTNLSVKDININIQGVERGQR